jgi:hypothetical protein
MRKSFYLFMLAPILLALSCTGGGGSSSGGGSSGSDYGYLNEHNASYNEGIIVRWETPILVNTNGVSGAENAFRQWGVPITFVNYNPSEGITVTIGNPGSGNCGITYSRWYRSNGRMISGEIVINSDLTRCVNTITHEACHAIGYRGHSTDGGLMDSAGGNGQITAAVRNMTTLLYSLPVGTAINQYLSMKKPALLPHLDNKKIPDGGGIVTWVDR